MLWLRSLWPGDIASSLDFVLLAINSLFWGAALSLLFYTPIFLKDRASESKSIEEDAGLKTRMAKGSAAEMGEDHCEAVEV